jgi:hypothetical protein
VIVSDEFFLKTDKSIRTDRLIDLEKVNVRRV